MKNALRNRAYSIVRVFFVFYEVFYSLICTLPSNEQSDFVLTHGKLLVSTSMNNECID